MAEKTISSVIHFEIEGETQKDRIKFITDKLEQGIKDLFNSDRYREYLATMSKFYDYSLNNTLLILFQKPDASRVAGFTAWKKKFHRYVKEGEKGIKIIAPAPYKTVVEKQKVDKSGQFVFDSDGKPVMEQTTVEIPTFKITSVFDLSQTDGEPLPDIATKLEGNVELYEKFFKTLKEISPVPIEFEDIKSGANGYYHLEDKRIAIKDNLSEMHTIKTAIHEIAHAKLHALPEPDVPEEEQKERPDNNTREVQAESVAYTVCQHFNIDTAEYSFGYIAGWSSGQETKELRASLEVIRETASEIIEQIEEKMPELSRDKLYEKHISQECEKSDVSLKDDKVEEAAKTKEKTVSSHKPNVKKPSVRKKLQKGKDKIAKESPKTKPKNKDINKSVEAEV